MSNNMTDLNAIRYYHKRVKRSYTMGNYERAMSLVNEATGLINSRYMNYCDFCIQEDFGYCGLRRSSQPIEEIRMEYCIPCLLMCWETEINKHNHRYKSSRKPRSMRNGNGYY